MNKIYLTGILSAFLGAAPLAAGPMSGGGYDVNITMVGSAGADNGSVTASGSGMTVLRSVGFITQGRTQESADGSRVFPGLFGGSPGMIPFSSPYTTHFGDASNPSSLFVPAFGLDQDYMVFTTSSATTAPLRVSPTVIEEANRNLDKSGPYSHPLNERIWEIHILQADGTIRAPRAPVHGDLTLPFRDADNDGIVDGTHPPIRDETLSIWWLDEDHALWVRIPGSEVNAGAKTVTASVRYASVFALMGSPATAVGEVRAFPTPWRPNGPKAGEGPGGTGSALGITFTNLPSEGTIRIFTLSGTLVREIRHTGGFLQHVWDGKNDAGEDVATGVYVFTISSDNAHKSGKLAVIR